ncbi:MAG: ABC transporter ATP-binding protein [Rhodospirillales bacterium]|nr:ABC transporter ATP-binding protein [Rhodospirillales bacterium]
MSDDAIVRIEGVTKTFAGNVTVVDRVDLRVGRGEFFALLGPSGCGKTTLLRMIAGFELPTDGRIVIDGEDMSTTPPNQRPINMVFQSYAVFPHMTVAKNVAYGLKVEGVAEAEIGPRVEEVLNLVKLKGYGARLPNQLSGGQRQRVALARALVKRPKVLLLDEPLSALDAKLREAMQLELVRLQHAVGITFIIVTHDQKEALSMADRIAVMESGKIRQLDTPERLYEYPSNRFVADFIGKMNLFEGKVVTREGARLLVDVTGLGRISVPHEDDIAVSIGVAVRPEKISLYRARPADSAITLQGIVTNLAYLGESLQIFLETESGNQLIISQTNVSRSGSGAPRKGENLWCSWQAADTLLLQD